MPERITIYFRDGMKTILPADKVVFVDGAIDECNLWCWLTQGMRVIRWESVNWVKTEVVANDLE